MTVRLTRRQWLELPLEWKTTQHDKHFVVTDGRLVPVQWCQRIEDSHMKEGIDTADNRQ